MTINEYLDNCKKVLSLSSDARLGMHLGLTRSAVSLWRTERSAPDDYACFQIANILNKDPRKVIADVRLEVEKDEDRKDFWKETSLEYGFFTLPFALFLNVAAIIVYILC